LLLPLIFCHVPPVTTRYSDSANYRQCARYRFFVHSLYVCCICMYVYLEMTNKMVSVLALGQFAPSAWNSLPAFVKDEILNS